MPIFCCFGLSFSLSVCHCISPCLSLSLYIYIHVYIILKNKEKILELPDSKTYDKNIVVLAQKYTHTYIEKYIPICMYLSYSIHRPVCTSYDNMPICTYTHMHVGILSYSATCVYVAVWVHI